MRLGIFGIAFISLSFMVGYTAREIYIENKEAKKVYGVQDASHCILAGNSTMYCKRFIQGKGFCYYKDGNLGVNFNCSKFPMTKTNSSSPTKGNNNE